MLSIASRNRTLSLRLPIVVIAACAALAAASAPASAAPGSGAVKLAVGGGALAESGVKVAAIAPAKKRGGRIALPIKTISVGKAANVVLRGGVRFKAGKRALRLRAFRLKLSAGRVSISAKAGKRRLMIFATRLPKGKAKLDRSKTTAKVARAKLALTRRGAKLLRNRLGVDDITAGALGKLGVNARPKSGGTGGSPGSGPGSGGGAGGGGGPQAGPIKNEPPILARPAGAVDVTDASLIWRPRESWIQYINGGEGTSVFGGAVNGSPEPRPGQDPLVYSFLGFPFANGWYEAATGKAAIYFQGGVGFRWSAHGINFSTANPEIEINSSASRAIFTFNGTENTKYDNQRGVLIDLHPASIQTTPNGTVTYTNVPGTIPADTGASVFAGFYPANSDFGTMTVSFTTP
jgi:hypothetical protein